MTSPSAGSPVLSEAAAPTADAPPDNSRRVTARAAQAKAAATGACGSTPPPIKSSRPLFAVDSSSRTVAVMTGASAGVDVVTTLTAGSAAAAVLSGTTVAPTSCETIAAVGTSSPATGGRETAESRWAGDLSAWVAWEPLFAAPGPGAVIGCPSPSRPAAPGSSTAGIAVSSSERWRRVGLRPARAAPANPAGDVEAEELSGVPVREAPRGRRFDSDSPDFSATPAVADAPELLPPVSAAANPGSPTITPPTPRATASAPTRPT